MKLLAIPKGEYENYRLEVIFRGYKWDPQFLDSNTIADHILVITEKEHAELSRLTERLAAETAEAEAALNENLKLAAPLALPGQIGKELKRMKNYRADGHIRLMRFDFHPVAGGGFAVSEVNSDVPGGFAEASLLPEIAMGVLGENMYRHIDFGGILAGAIAKKVRPGGRVMLVHCTSYSDDRQVMQFLGDKLETLGFRAIYAAADHLRFENGAAVSLLGGNTGKIDAIFRFTPLEWLIGIKPKRWQGYFDTTTPSCNHPIAIFAQTKRFPLVWDALQKSGLELSAWRSLLPETLEVKEAKRRKDFCDFVYKPACGRVGEGISIKEACTGDEYEKIIRDAERHPKKYLAQRRFASRPLPGENGGSYHVCLGAFAVEGRAAGYYARMSAKPRIDSRAADIAVLIEREIL